MKKEFDIKLIQLFYEKEFVVVEVEVEVLRLQEEIGGDDDYRFVDIFLLEDNRFLSLCSRIKEYVEKYFNNLVIYNLDIVLIILQIVIFFDLGVFEFVKFFLKKDLFFVCLSIFIEELEVYFLWKGGFNL